MSPDAILAGKVFSDLDEANRQAARMDLDFIRDGNPRRLEVVPAGKGWIIREVERVS